MKYLPISVVNSEQAAPKRKIAILWIIPTISGGIQSNDEILFAEEVIWGSPDFPNAICVSSEQALQRSSVKVMRNANNSIRNETRSLPFEYKF